MRCCCSAAANAAAAAAANAAVHVSEAVKKVGRGVEGALTQRATVYTHVIMNTITHILHKHVHQLVHCSYTGVEVVYLGGGASTYALYSA